MGVRAQEGRVLWAEERPVSGACLACLRNHKTVCDMSARKAGVGVVADEVQELVGGGGGRPTSGSGRWFSEYVVLTLRTLKTRLGLTAESVLMGLG